jgi:hypothetical protein
MGAIIELAVVVIAVGLVASLFMRRRRTAERETLMERRVEAYMQTIRRQADNAELAAMTDLELRDLLLSGARNLKMAAERRFYVLAVGGGIGLIAAITAASQDGLRGFGIGLAVAAVIIYGVWEFLGRRMREPLEGRGIDIDRLRVE